MLDGFAGTGAVGIEALSRGAAHVTFVEKDRRAAALIEENAQVCGLKGGYTIALRRRSVRHISVSRRSFDLILLDPPYDIGDVHAVLDRGGRACFRPTVCSCWSGPRAASPTCHRRSRACVTSNPATAR